MLSIDYFMLPLYFSSAVVIPMNEKPIRKPRSVKIDPEALHRARVEALRARKTVGEWLEEAIDEKVVNCFYSKAILNFCFIGVVASVLFSLE